MLLPDVHLLGLGGNALLALANAPTPFVPRSQPVAANYTNYDCGLAYGQYAYADYTGMGYSTPELQSAANYQTGAEYAQRPFGWTAYLCNAQAYDYICEYPFSAFRWAAVSRPVWASRKPWLAA